jgi:hypothetical protein
MPHERGFAAARLRHNSDETVQAHRRWDVAFWPVALIATAVVIFGSVEAGKALGAGLLAHAATQQGALKMPAASSVQEVVGGQVHAAAAPGQPSPVLATPTRTHH